MNLHWFQFICKVSIQYYGGIAIVCRGPMFIAFEGNPSQRIQIPMNVDTTIYWIFIYKTELATEEIRSPRFRNFSAFIQHWPYE